MKKVISYSQAISLSDIIVKHNNITLFSCRKNDIINFKEIYYDKSGIGHLIIKDNVDVILTAFKLI